MSGPTRRALLLALCTLAGGASGCGVQLGAGWQGRSTTPDVEGPPPVMSLGVRLMRPRGHGPYIGSDTLATTPAFAGDVAVRQVLITGGYRFVHHPFAFELGADLGAGQPALLSIGGTGFYLGGAPALLFRLCGEHDARTGYAVAGVLIDLVAIGRIGVWGRPGGDPGKALLDGGAQLGVRISFISDIARANTDNWEPQTQ